MTTALPDAALSASLPDAALERLFGAARTAHGFRPDPVPDSTLLALYDLLKWAPTAYNMQPARFVFVRSPQAKERLRKGLMEGNIPQAMAAPVTAIVAYDTRFYDHLPEQFPVLDVRGIFAENPALAQEAAFRNGTLQGAYLIMAARSLGLDCGPMSGFHPAVLDAEFFPDGRFRSNFLVNLGVADPEKHFPRGPRLPFEVAARIL